jgi:hypothetical protein
VGTISIFLDWEIRENKKIGRKRDFYFLALGKVLKNRGRGKGEVILSGEYKGLSLYEGSRPFPFFRDKNHSKIWEKVFES